MTADAYLRRWLAAREWDVELALKCIVRHAGWREHVMPAGYMPEVSEWWMREMRGGRGMS